MLWCILRSRWSFFPGGLGNLKGRGVVLKEVQTLASLYDERVPLYEKYADIVVDEEDKDLEGSLQVVLEALKNRGDKA